MKRRGDPTPPAHWQDFEDLCLKLWRPRLIDAKKHGRAGQPQAGVDIFGRDPKTETWVGIQCKQKGQWPPKVLTIRQIKDGVRMAANFKPPLSHFIMATTAQRDVKSQEFVRRLGYWRRRAGNFSVDLYTWDDLQDWLHEEQQPAAEPPRPADGKVELTGAHEESEVSFSVDFLRKLEFKERKRALLSSPSPEGVNAALAELAKLFREIELRIERINNSNMPQSLDLEFKRISSSECELRAALTVVYKVEVLWVQPFKNCLRDATLRISEFKGIPPFLGGDRYDYSDRPERLIDQEYHPDLSENSEMCWKAPSNRNLTSDELADEIVDGLFRLFDADG